jgi:hypothetical protein
LSHDFNYIYNGRFDEIPIRYSQKEKEKIMTFCNTKYPIDNIILLVALALM